MARSSIIKAIITADTKGFGKALDSIDTRMKATGRTLTRNLSLPIAAAGVAAFKMGSDLNEATTQAQQVFGRNAEEMIRQSQNLSDSFSETEFLSFASNLGDISQGLGFAQDESAALSTSVLSLAQDLGSFKNLPTERAVNAITAALTGEREALKGLGIVVQQADVDQKALAMGLAETTAELTKQDRAQATLALITAAAANAIGDFDRTADGAANQARILSANFQDMASNLGQQLIPIGTKLLEWAMSAVDMFSNLSDGTQTAALLIAGLALAIGPIVGVIGSMVTAVQGLSVALTFLAANPLVAVAAGIGLLASGILIWRNNAKDSARDTKREFENVEGTIKGLQGTFDNLTGAATQSSIEFLAAELEARGMADAFIDAGLTGSDLITALDTMETMLADTAVASAVLGNQRDPIKDLANSFGLLDTLTLDQITSFIMLYTDSKKGFNITNALVGDLAGGLGDVEEAADDAKTAYSEMVDEFIDSLNVHADTEELLGNITEVLGNLDEMTPDELKGALADLTGDFTDLWDGASAYDINALQADWGLAAYGLALIGNAADLSSGQVEGFYRTLGGMPGLTNLAPAETNPYTNPTPAASAGIGTFTTQDWAELGRYLDSRPVVVEIDGLAVVEATSRVN